MIEKQHGKTLLKDVAAQRGLWALKVVNEAGIYLRKHPIDCSQRERHMRVEPEVLFPKGYTLLADTKVVSSAGVEFYCVQGTDGWVFTRRGEVTMMKVVSLSRAYDEAVKVKCVTEGPKRPSKNILEVSSVRRIAKEYNLEEIQINDASRMISFRKALGRGCEGGPVRINVYYSTGTVGTALCHPVQGRTQLFRRNCSYQDLHEVFENPRWHSGKGYQRRRIAEDKCIAAEVETSTFHEERFALSQSLFQLDSEIQDLIESRKAVLLSLLQYEDDRLDEAKKEAERKKQEKLKQIRDMEAEEGKAFRSRSWQKRGENVQMRLGTSPAEMIDVDSVIVALLDNDGLVAMNTKNRYVFHGHIPNRLYQLLRTRAASHPHPVALSMGSCGRFFVKFSNGKTEWCAQNAALDAILLAGTTERVAFGADVNTFVALTAKGPLWKGSLPSRLKRHLLGNREIHNVSLGPHREWFVAFKDGHSEGGGFDSVLNASWSQCRRKKETVRDLVFGSGGTFVMRYSEYNGPF